MGDKEQWQQPIVSWGLWNPWPTTSHLVLGFFHLTIYGFWKGHCPLCKVMPIKLFLKCISLKEAYTTLDFHVFFTYPISLVLVILLTTTSSLLSSYPSPLKPFCHMTLWVFDTTQWEFGFFLWSFSWNCIMPSVIM